MKTCEETGKQRRWTRRGLHVIGMGVLWSGLFVAGTASAFDLALSNPDYKLRWDNTVRYSYGQRLQSRDAVIDRAGGFSFDQSNALFDKGDAITNRLDLYTELDFAFQSRYGARISAAAWYDDAYGSKAASTANPSAYVNNDFTPVVNRFYHNGGELLDAYVYGRFDAGVVPIDARLGKHTVIWGEGLFGSTNSVAYGQAPSDGRKAAANPAASAKETALPVGQVSAIVQLTDELVLSGQYLYKWAPNRIPEGGTFFAGADTILLGPNVGRGPSVEGDKGDVGLSLRWRPEWMNGSTLGAYYRKFDEKSFWSSQLNPATGLRGAVFAKDIELYGLSLATIVGGGSVGAEISHRSNMPLNSRGAVGSRLEGAKGSTWHALVNGVWTYGTSSFFDSASLAGEVSMSRLDKVTANPGLYRSAGNVAVGCATEDIVGGCSTQSFYTAGVSFIPVWTQVFPSVDLKLPVFISANLKGNAPTNGGGSEGFRIYRVGLQAEAYARHMFELAVTYYDQKIDEARSTVLGAPYKDKAWLSFTYQTTF